MLSVFALSGFAYFGLQAVLLNLYLLRLGYGPEFIGPMIGLGQGVWAAMALPAGALGRRWGTRRALITWQSLHAIGMLIVLSAESVSGGGRTAALLVGWSVFWIGGAFGAANGTPFIMHVTTPDVRHRVFSAQVAMFASLGFVGSAVAGVLPGAIASWLGTSLDATTPYRAVLALVPVAHVVCALMLTRATDVRPDIAAIVAPHARLPASVLAFFGLIVFLQTASEGAVRTFFNVYLDKNLHMPTAQIGGVFSWGQVAAVLGAVASPALLSRFGSARAMMWATLASSLSLAALGAFPMALPAVASYGAALAAASLNTAARSIFGQELVPTQWRTIAAAVQTVGLGLGWAIAASAGGVLITQLGYEPYFLLSAGIAAVAAVLMTRRARLRAA